MSAPTEARPVPCRRWRDGAVARLLGRLQAALLILLLAAGAAAAQGQPLPEAAWAVLVTRAETAIADADTTTPALEALRSDLAVERDALRAAAAAAQVGVDELQARLDALGPPPAEGATEAPEVAQRRQELNAAIAEARAPVAEANERARHADDLIQQIDRIIRGRFTAEIRSRGPSPLLPGTWLTAAGELGRVATAARVGLAADLADPQVRANVLRKLPVNLLLVLAGLAITFSLRRWLSEWIESRLATTTDRKLLAWLVAIQGVSRLIVPAVGAGLLFAAFDPGALLGRTESGLFKLPMAVVLLIAASWLAGSFFSPSLPSRRLAPLDDADARTGARLTMILGGVAALELALGTWLLRLDLAPSTKSALLFPLILVAGLALWRTADLIGRCREGLDLSAGEGPRLAQHFLDLLGRAIRILAVLGPVLAAAGYLAAALLTIFPTILTLGLIALCIVVFDLLNVTATSLLSSPEKPGDADGGLVPVVIAGMIICLALPALALIWGARQADLSDAWAHLRDGVTLGGFRLSLTALITLVLVAAAGIALTRLVQGIMRSYVLPRTRLDQGGRNAALAGIGYVGFAAAGLAAVGAAGLNLSSLAIVAGALSVGIGFGLQNIVSNFVSGIILLVERPIKEGDWIEVGGFSGYVRGIRVRATEIETFDRASVIIPNSDLIAGSVLNRTHKSSAGRLIVPVRAGFDSDPREVERVLLGLAEGHPLVLEEPPPNVVFTGFGNNCFNFEIRCRLRDVNYSMTVTSELNYDIVRAFREHGISMPHPNTDVSLVVRPEEAGNPA